MGESEANDFERPTCYECGAPAIGIFEGVVPPAGTVRQPACEEHGLDMPPVRSFTRVGHCKRDSTDVYIGRGPGGCDMLETPIGKRGWLGNPHTVEDHGREGSIKRFRKAFETRLERDPEFRERVRDLAGKRLGCWCQSLDADQPACHGEVIAEHADRLASEQLQNQR